jgi:hypothetical protein
MRELTFSHIQNSALFTLFHGMKASDEMFFATTLSMLQCRSEIEPRRWTYAEWEGQAASPLLFQPAELMKNLPSLEDLRDSTSSSSAPPSSVPPSTDKMATIPYTLPAERHLHPVRHTRCLLSNPSRPPYPPRPPTADADDDWVSCVV